MNGIVIFVVIAILLTVASALLPATIWLYERQRGHAVLHQVAKHFDGDLVDRGRLIFPAIKFTRQGVEFHATARTARTARRGSANPIIRVAAACPDDGWRVTVIPESTSTRLKKLMGTREAQIGNAQFDEMFFIHTNSSEKLRGKLSADAQDQLVSLHARSKNSDFELDILGGQIRLEKSMSLRFSNGVIQYLEDFVQLFFLLYYQDQELMQVLKISRHEVHPRCLVCGQSIVERRVNCRSCKTPHHRECWEYFGKCSTFACGDVRYKDLTSLSSNKLWIR